MRRLKPKLIFFVSVPRKNKGNTGAVIGSQTVVEAVTGQSDVVVVEMIHKKIRTSNLFFARKEYVGVTLNYAKSLRRLISVLRQAEPIPNVLYLSASSSVAGTLRDLLTMLVAKFVAPKTRIILHSRNGDFLFPASWFLFKIRKEQLKLSDRLLMLSARLIPNSRDIRRLLRDGDESKIYIVPNTVDYGVIASHLEIETKFNQEGPITVVYLSNFIPSKGYLLLAEVIRKLEHDGAIDRFRFIFRGAWPDPSKEHEFRQRIGAAAIASGIVDIGQSVWDREEVKSILLRSDILCLPTSYHAEAQPRSILEAMACGCSILATDHASIADMVESGINGLLVTDDVVDEMYRYLISLDRDAVKQQGRQSRALFEERFSPTAHAHAIQKAIF